MRQQIVCYDRATDFLLNMKCSSLKFLLVTAVTVGRREKKTEIAIELKCFKSPQKKCSQLNDTHPQTSSCGNLSMDVACRSPCPEQNSACAMNRTCSQNGTCDYQ